MAMTGTVVEENVSNYLRAERQSLVELLELFTGKLAEVDALLQEQSGLLSPGKMEITETRSDPFKTLDRWPMTSTTTMGLCREALGRFGREATAAEIAGLIKQGSDVIPAKSIAEMLYKRGSKERSGIYRVHRIPGPAKYGLIAWKRGGADRSSDGGFQAPDEEVNL
jgi:hypothetical protein